MQRLVAISFDNKIQADWVRPEDIGDYPTLDLPYPVMLLPETAAAIAAVMRLERAR